MVVEHELKELIDMLVYEHDSHMKAAYARFLENDDVSDMWAYGAGLQHAIRCIQDIVYKTGYSQ